MSESGARVYFHTLGCPKNDADSRTLMRYLAAAGVARGRRPRRSTHIVVNTCGFIQDAKEESIEAILSVCAAYPEQAGAGDGLSGREVPRGIGAGHT